MPLTSWFRKRPQHSDQWSFPGPVFKTATNFCTNRRGYQSLPVITPFGNDTHFKRNCYLKFLDSSNVTVSQLPSQRQFQSRILVHVLEQSLQENSGLRNELWIFCQAPDKCKKWICLRSSKPDTNYVCKVFSIVSETILKVTEKTIYKSERNSRLWFSQASAQEEGVPGVIAKAMTSGRHLLTQSLRTASRLGPLCVTCCAGHPRKHSSSPCHQKGIGCPKCNQADQHILKNIIDCVRGKLLDIYILFQLLLAPRVAQFIEGPWNQVGWLIKSLMISLTRERHIGV